MSFPKEVLEKKTVFKSQWNILHQVLLTIHILLKLQDVDLNLKDIYFLLTLHLGFLGIVQKLLTIEIFYPRWWNTLLTIEKAVSTQDNGRIIFLFFITTHLLFFFFFTSNLIYCSILIAFIELRKNTSRYGILYLHSIMWTQYGLWPL